MPLTHSNTKHFWKEEYSKTKCPEKRARRNKEREKRKATGTTKILTLQKKLRALFVMGQNLIFVLMIAD